MQQQKKRRWGGKKNQADDGDDFEQMNGCLVVLFFHHLLNEDKRRLMVEWATALQLVGLSKAGHPGIVFVAGYQVENVHKFIQRLRTLRWQTMEIRLEHQGSRAYIDDIIKEISERDLTADEVEDVFSYANSWPTSNFGPKRNEDEDNDADDDIYVSGGAIVRPPLYSSISSTASQETISSSSLRPAPLFPSGTSIPKERTIHFLELGCHNSLGLVPKLLGDKLWTEIVRTAPMDPYQYRLAQLTSDQDRPPKISKGVSEDLWKGMTPPEKRAFDEGGAGPCEVPIILSCRGLSVI